MLSIHIDLDKPEILVVVSDLHLSEGWDEQTKKLSRNEDFFFDRSFERFLSHFSRRRYAKYRICLVIAGDFVDFLQVTSKPGYKVGCEEATPSEEKFGLGTSPNKTCWKLRKIMDGHWILFQALAEFLALGNEVLIIPGNHDIEFTMPKVQQCLRDELKNYLPKSASPSVANSMEENLQFLPWFYYEPGLIYIEHGHQYDSLNSFDYLLHPYLPNTRVELIDLPAGSFFVRYLFNKLEIEYPFADNMKPVARFLWWVLWPWHMRRLKNVWPYLWFFWLILYGKAGPLDFWWKKKQERTQLNILSKLASDFGIEKGALEKIKEHWEPSALHNLGRAKLLCNFFWPSSGKDPYCEVAKEICNILQVRYVVFGHTHEACIKSVGAEATESEYINSGTWTKVFAANYEEVLLKEENEFAFVVIDKSQKGNPHMELLRWRDDIGWGERIRLFESLK